MIIKKTFVKIFILFSCILYCIFANGQSSIVGSLDGVIAITPTGIANYSIPIEVVSGTSGIQPNLNITYNSASNRGLLGIGWHISGISSISRVQKTYYPDGEMGCINFDDNDRYVIDGQRLIKLSSGIYSETNATYGTEIENFTRVFLNGTPYTLSQYFTASTEQGYIIEYGYTPDSKLISDNKIVSWYQNKITDPDGNYMTISYGRDTNNGEVWPTEINYTGNTNAGLNTYAKVKFTYSTDQNINVSYIGGKKLQSSKLLNNIQIIYGSELVRQYDFEYLFDRTTRLNAVILKDALGNEITRTIIEWGNDSTSNLVNIDDYDNLSENMFIMGDYNGDNCNDAFMYKLYGNKNYSWKIKNGSINADFSETNLSGIIDNVESFFTIDTDGDGKDEIGYISYNTNTNQYDLNTIKSFGNNNYIVEKIISNETKNIIWGDFLGKGSIQFLLGSEVNDNDLISFRNNFGKPILSVHKNNIISIVDFNGNGKSDIHLINNGNVSVYEYYNDNVLSNLMNGILIDTNHKGGFHGDFNADGKTDYLYYTSSNFYIRYSTGSYYTNPVQLPFTPNLSSDNSLTFPIFVADINGDGKDDIISLSFNYNTQLLTFNTYYTRDFNNNTYNYELTSEVYNKINTFYESHFQFSDINNDGSTDMIYKSTFDDIPKVVSFKERREHDLVMSIINGFGKKTSMQYSYYNSPNIGYLGKNAKKIQYPIVKKLREPDGIGGYSETILTYGQAIFDFERRQLLGFLHYRSCRNDFNTQMLFQHDTTFHHLGLVQNVNYIKQRSEAETGGCINDSSYWNKNRSDFYHYETYNTLAYHSLSYKRFIQYASISNQTNRLDNTQKLSKIWLDTDGRIISLSTTHYKSKQENHQSIWISIDSTMITYKNIILPNSTRIIKPYVIISWNIMNGCDKIPLKRIVYNYSSGRLSNVDVYDSDGKISNTAYDYNNLGLKTRKTITPYDMPVRSNTYTYDLKGRFLTCETNALGHTITTMYDEKTGYVISETDANNLTSSYEYDVWGRIIKIIRPDLTQKNITYNWNDVNTFNNAIYYIQETEAGTPDIKTYYDIYHRPIHIYTENIGYNDIVYNNIGLICQTTFVSYPYTSTNTTSKVWHYKTYDAYNRLIDESAPYLSLSYTYYDYNNPSAKDYFVSTTDNISNVQYTKKYDAIGRIIQATDPGGSINYHYTYENISGKIRNKTTCTIGNDSTIIISDLRGNHISIQDPDAGMIINVYNALNQLIKRTDANGNTTTYVYDLLGRTIHTQRTNGHDTETILYTYDNASGKGKGLLANIQKNGKDEFTNIYDDFGRISNRIVHDNTQTYNHKYSYNTLGQLKYITYPDGFKIEKIYNSYGELSQIKNATNNTLIYAVDTRNKFRQPLKCRYGNGTGIQYTYNNYGMLTGIQNGNIHFTSTDSYSIATSNNTGVGNPVLSNYSIGNQYRKLQYTYDNRGLIVSRSDSKVAQTETYSYDNLDRLTSYQINGGQVISYSFSNDGNITSNTKVGSYDYNSSKPHALTKVYVDNTTSINDSQCDVVYNMGNRATSISKGDYSITFDYDASDMRRHTYFKQNEVVIASKIRISNLHEIIIKENSRNLDYIYADSRIVAVNVRSDNNDSIYYVMTDHLGSWNKVIDENKNIVQETHFDPWGNRMTYNAWNVTQTQTSFAFDRGFTGHEHYDRFKIINTNARLYDPVVGRFFSPDPLVQAPDFTQSFNRYSYCLNNPIMYSDPDGEFWHIVIGAAIGGSMNLIMNWNKCEQWYDYASYFAIGAVAGGLSAGVGAGVSSAIAGGGFATGFVGSQTAGIAVSSFCSGAAIGGSSGLSSGFILGAGNSWMEGSSLRNGLIDGMKTGLLGGVGGVMTGGIISGIDAVKDGRNFFTGNKLVDTYLRPYSTGYEFAQEADSHDCAPSVTKIIEKYKGNDISVKQIRDIYASGTTSMDNVEDIRYWMNYDNKYEMSSSNINGIDMNVIYNRFSGGKHVPLSIKVGDDSHTVLINRMEIWETYKWGKQSIPSIKYKTWVIDPMTGYPRRLCEKIINAFFIK